VFAFRPTPPELSAAWPVYGAAGPVPAEKRVPSTGDDTDAVIGGVLSTVNVELGPAATALLPAVSVAVPAAMEIPRVPPPVIPEIATVRVVAVAVVTVTVIASAVPVLFSVMSPAESVMMLPVEYVTV